MTKKQTEVAKVEKTAVAITPPEDALAALRAGSGESGDFPFLPIIIVDNSKVEEQLSGGRTGDGSLPSSLQENR